MDIFMKQCGFRHFPAAEYFDVIAAGIVVGSDHLHFGNPGFSAEIRPDFNRFCLFVNKSGKRGSRVSEICFLVLQNFPESFKEGVFPHQINIIFGKIPC